MSAVIPCFNASAVLADAVASARAQTYPVEDVIVVDDASTDGTAELAERLGATVVRQPENRGPSAARNAGIARAGGDVVAFLDADDVWLPWHVELCVRALEEHPRAAVACTASAEWDGAAPVRPAAARTDVPSDPVVALLERPFIPQTAAVVRRSAVQAAGGYDEARRYAEDYDLWLRLARRHEIVRVDAPGVRRRTHAGQASRATPRMLASGFELRLRALAEIAAGPDAARTARAAAGIAQTIERELADRWHWKDSASFAYLLDLARRVPGTDALRRRWTWRRRLTWHAWHAARRAKYLVLRRAPDGNAPVA